MVQGNLRLVIDIVVDVIHLAVGTETVSGVETVGRFAFHIVLYILPTFNSQTVAIVSLVMPLRSTECSEAELMAGVESFGDVKEVGVRFLVGSLNVTIGPFARTEHRDGPTVFHESG